MINRPSFQRGYARNSSESANPGLWRGLRGAWVPAMGPNGDTLRDLSGFGTHGTLTNMDLGTAWVVGKNGLALDFDGVNDNINIDSTVTHITGDITVNILATADSFSTTAYENTLFSCAGAAEAEINNFIYHFTVDNGFFRTFWEYGAGTNQVTVSSSSTTMNTGQEYLFTFSRDSIAKTMTFLLGGVQVGNVVSYANNPTGGSNGVARIGTNAETIDRGWNGKIACVLMHNRPMVASEVRPLAKNILAPFELRPRKRGFVVVGGVTGIIGQAAEANVVSTFTSLKAGSIAQVVEINTANVMTATSTAMINQAIESDIAQAITGLSLLEIGQVGETDSALTFTAESLKQINQVAEVDTSQAMTILGATLLGVSTELDSAQAVSSTKTGAVDQVLESDASQTLTSTSATVIGQPSETDSAFAISGIKTDQISQTSETDTSQALSSEKSGQINQVTEIDAAQAFTSGSVVSIGQALEADTALSIESLKVSVIGQVFEINTALLMDVAGGVVNVPAERMFLISADDRSYLIPADNRIVIITE